MTMSKLNAHATSVCCMKILQLVISCNLFVRLYFYSGCILFVKFPIERGSVHWTLNLRAYDYRSSAILCVTLCVKVSTSAFDCIQSSMGLVPYETRCLTFSCMQPNSHVSEDWNKMCQSH